MFTNTIQKPRPYCKEGTWLLMQFICYPLLCCKYSVTNDRITSQWLQTILYAALGKIFRTIHICVKTYNSGWSKRTELSSVPHLENEYRWSVCSCTYRTDTRSQTQTNGGSIQDFQQGTPTRGGAKLLFGNFFAKNCMKIKEILLGEGTHP